MTAVYIDGFNLYNGLAAPLGCKWVDLNRLFETMTGGPIDKIWFFTALISGPRVNNQNLYLAALCTLPNVEVVEGHFKKKTVSCRANGCPLGCLEPACSVACSATNCPCAAKLATRPNASRRFQTREEKHTDVNIAIQMLDDAYRTQPDRMIVVSGDSDLVPAMRRVKERFPNTEIVLSVPCLGPTDPRGLAGELRDAADRTLPIPLKAFVESQFPPLVRKRNGKKLQMPADWVLAQESDIAPAIAAMEAWRNRA